MRGHEAIIAMRNAGKRPSIVFINDYPDVCASDWHNPGEKFGKVWAPDHATVSTADDVIQMLDMRFLVGLRVSISSESEIRAKALFEKAKACGAVTVAAGHSLKSSSGRVSTGWCEIFHKQEVVSG